MARRATRGAPRTLHLVIFSRDTAETVAIPVGATVTVGRGLDCDLRVERPELSRRHFRIESGRDLLITDLGGVNGTVLNGLKMPPHAPVALRVGAIIEAGGVLFMLREEAEARPPHGQRPAAEAAPGTAVVVEDAAMVRLHDLVALVAQSTMSVLVVGETGVGKEILSHSVHRQSARADQPFVRVNCAALPEALLESELFGYEKGAFTGATQSKRGLIESADGGSFFLDEIGEMPLTTQAKLLRVLESRDVMRLGGLKPQPIDVRFIAATNAHLPGLIAKGEFRRDLYYRLNGITIPIPPLRDRASEIPSLARTFAAARASATARPAPAFSEEALAILRGYAWPGNVRQLKNVVDRALALCRESTIRPEHVVLDATDVADPAAERRTLPAPAPVAAPTARGGRMRIDPDVDREKVRAALEAAQGNQGRAAALLGVSRRTLMKWLDDHQLPRPRKART